MSTEPRRVAVIGAGITGLAAAHALATTPQATTGGLQITVIEADQRLGGKLHTSPFAGHPAIDEGPDAFLARLPWATALARTVGLGDELVSPEAGRAAVWFDRLHPIPERLLLGMPTDVLALARSRLLTWGGKFRAGLEPFLPRTSLEPDSLGTYVRARFGDQVQERLVDPLVGSIYAAATPLPDLILLDVTMPDMDGYEVCRQLMNNPVTAGIPVIFLTIRNEELDEQLGFDAGAIDYITKPISPPLVLTRIRNHLNLKAASDFLRDRNSYLEQEVRRRTRELSLIQDATIVAMASLAETRDNETGL